jgi:ATP-dependent DNA helicase RecG
MSFASVKWLINKNKQATIAFKEKYSKGEIIETTSNVGVNVGVKLSTIQENIIKQISLNNAVTQVEMAKKLKVTEMTIYRNIEKLKTLGILERKGADKTGIWIIKQVK